MQSRGGEEKNWETLIVTIQLSGKEKVEGNIIVMYVWFD